MGQWPNEWFELPLTVFDLETTGFDPQTCQIIEIGMVQFYRGKLENRIIGSSIPNVKSPKISSSSPILNNLMSTGSPSFAK